MRKKLFTLLLTLAASIGPLFAESGTCGTNLTWDLTNGVLTISGTGAMDNYSSNFHAPWYSNRSSITTVIINNSVTSIGQYAFRWCSSLTSVTIPNSVTSIRYGAFDGCSSLASLTIPNSVTSIGLHAFDDCISLPVVDNLRYADTYLVEAVDKTLSTYNIMQGTKWIGNDAFSDCSSLISIEIPNSVISIGWHAFSGCKNLTFVTIPSSVTYIGGRAFENCRSLTSVTIPNGVTSIGEYAFYNVPNIIYSGTAIGSPWEAKCMNGYAEGYLVYSDESKTILKACSAAAQGEIIIPNSVTTIGDWAFCDCSSLISVTIPNSVTSIWYGAFDGCSSLTSVTIPNSVTSIGYSVFSGCSSLTSVTVPNSVTSIGYSVFSGCSSLTSVTIPNSVTSIGEYAFKNCTGLTSVTIPESVTSIGSSAFYGCSNLANIYLEATNPPSIKSTTFSNISSGALVHVKFGYAGLYRNANYWKNMNIQVAISHSTLTSPTGVNVGFTADGEIASCGISDGEQQPGNVLEYIGLEPNSEYKDIPVVLTSNTGETETVNISFTTTALELTTKPSKAVSSTTAILLAETNMSDAEVSCGFEYKRNDAPADMEGNKVYCPVASGQMAGRLKGLKDDVYYKYRAFYQSAAGNMYYGDWQYIFTGDVAVEFDPILYTYGATVVRENEATISGYALAGSEDFTEQGFEYWAESRTNSGANAPHRVPAALNEHFFVQASGIALRATLTNLDAGTVYKYRVYGKVGDQYYYGAEQSFATQGEYEGDDSEAIEEVPSDQVQSTKVVRDGQIYILRGDKTYTLQGQEVK